MGQAVLTSAQTGQTCSLNGTVPRSQSRQIAMNGPFPFNRDESLNFCQSLASFWWRAHTMIGNMCNCRPQPPSVACHSALKAWDLPSIGRTSKICCDSRCSWITFLNVQFAWTFMSWHDIMIGVIRSNWEIKLSQLGLRLLLQHCSLCKPMRLSISYLPQSDLSVHCSQMSQALFQQMTIVYPVFVHGWAEPVQITESTLRGAPSHLSTWVTCNVEMKKRCLYRMEEAGEYNSHPHQNELHHGLVRRWSLLVL